MDFIWVILGFAQIAFDVFFVCWMFAQMDINDRNETAIKLCVKGLKMQGQVNARFAGRDRRMLNFMSEVLDVVEAADGLYQKEKANING